MSVIDNVISYGLGEVGKPYVYGAEGPGSFDCSGLMQFIFGKAGIKLPRTADQQYRWSTKVNSPLPGDLVFWVDNNTGKASHVALYLGNNKVLAAPHTGADVKIETLFNEAGHTRHYGRVPGAGAVTGAVTATVGAVVQPVLNLNPFHAFTSAAAQDAYGVALQVGGAMVGGALIIAGFWALSRPAVRRAASQIEGAL